jgi:RimJ/RimL family protein N-acetyltransferase
MDLVNIKRKLFDGKVVRLAAIDFEKDIPVEADYTTDPDYVHWLRREPYRPMAKFELRKYYEDRIKTVAKKTNCIDFVIRTLDGDLMAGYARINHMELNHTGGNLEMGFGSSDLRDRCLEDALDLLTTYSFMELGFTRLTAFAHDYETELMECYARSGFSLEVRQRQAMYRQGQYHDWLWYGLLVNDWLDKRKADC